VTTVGTAMAGAPRVSVIIPTYNRARDVGRCLDSLVQQTFKDFEVLVCDDGSVDATAAVVEPYKSRLALTYHWAENFGGPARPRNTGLQLARGEYLAFLDSDDWWMPDKLRISVLHLEQGADFIYHDLLIASRRSQKLYWRRSGSRRVSKPVFDDLLVHGNAINNSSVVMRTELLRAVGGFAEDPNLIAAEDYDAWLRVARRTDGFVRIPQALGYYWMGDGNLSNPKRTIRTSEALEARYAQEFSRVRSAQPMDWLSYAKARAHFDLGSYVQASRNLAAVDLQRAPLTVRARTMWMRLRMAMNAGGNS
jgi:glycosyltransferase involved in cell wall biosynthesis